MPQKNSPISQSSTDWINRWKRLLVFAKTPTAAKELNRQLQTSGFGKYYQAVLLGCPDAPDGTLHDFLIKDGRTNTSRVCTKETPGAKPARLSYHIVKTKHGVSLAGNSSVYRHTSPDSGTKWQISDVPLQVTGNMARKSPPFLSSQLFACRLNFTHPDTKKLMEFIHTPVLHVFDGETPADHPA